MRTRYIGEGLLAMQVGMVVNEKLDDAQIVQVSEEIAEAGGIPRIILCGRTEGEVEHLRLEVRERRELRSEGT